MSELQIKRENGKIFCPLTNSWHIETPEEKVRQQYINSLPVGTRFCLQSLVCYTFCNRRRLKGNEASFAQSI